MTDNRKPILTIDIKEFEHHLAHCDGTDEEKREYLQLLWQIICEVVSYGWGVQPLQQVLDDDNSTCGKESVATDEPTLLGQDMLQSLHADLAENDKEAPATQDVQEEGVTV